MYIGEEREHILLDMTCLIAILLISCLYTFTYLPLIKNAVLPRPSYNVWFYVGRIQPNRGWSRTPDWCHDRPYTDGRRSSATEHRVSLDKHSGLPMEHATRAMAKPTGLLPSADRVLLDSGPRRSSRRRRFDAKALALETDENLTHECWTRRVSDQRTFAISAHVCL